MPGKRWIPLESNPKLFNDWAEQAGLVTAEAQFQDVYGLDDDVLAFVVQPVRAVILLFPDNKEVSAQRKAEDEKIAKEGQPKLDTTVMWIKQTIDNACGTMAILHALINSGVTIAPMSPLAQFIEQCQDKTPFERSEILETTPLFEKIHTETAAAGQSAIPEGLAELHFIAFVEAPDQEFRAEPGSATLAKLAGMAPVEEPGYSRQRLIELDGSRESPMDRGECKDLLKDVAKLVKEKYVGESSSIEFNLIALGGPVDAV